MREVLALSGSFMLVIVFFINALEQEALSRLVR